MPQPRRLTDEKENAALAMYRNGVQIADLARTYDLTWKGMRDCLERAKAREEAMLVSRGTIEAGQGA